MLDVNSSTEQGHQLKKSEGLSSPSKRLNLKFSHGSTQTNENDKNNDVACQTSLGCSNSTQKETQLSLLSKKTIEQGTPARMKSEKRDKEQEDDTVDLL